ncbi:MAG: formyltransferase family protein [Rhizomicrobium sp.]
MTSNYPYSSPPGFSLPPCPLSPTLEPVYGNTITSTYADGQVVKVYVEAVHTYSIALAGRCITIHRSFLPSFKGAKPYHQSHEHGVKIIGVSADQYLQELEAQALRRSEEEFGFFRGQKAPRRVNKSDPR